MRCIEDGHMKMFCKLALCSTCKISFKRTNRFISQMKKKEKLRIIVIFR